LTAAQRQTKVLAGQQAHVQQALMLLAPLVLGVLHACTGQHNYHIA
jgi:hypothetical protein